MRISRSGLVRATFAIAALFAAMLAFVLFASLTPSAGTAPQTLVVSIASIRPDTFLDTEWNGRPVIVFRPGPGAELDLTATDSGASPPLSVVSLPPAFVYYGISTHLGCKLVHKPRGTIDDAGGAIWRGGWMGACDGGLWDYAGRNVRHGGAPVLPNLRSPKFRFGEGRREVVLL